MASEPSKNRGFTLIELLVTLTVAAILLGVAVPNFSAFLQNNRLTSQANDFVTLLNYARSEAVKRNSSVTVCASANANAANPACSGATTWETGIILFNDVNGDGNVNGTDVVLQARQALESGNTLRAGTRTRVTYQANGFSPASSDTFTLCDARGTAFARAIALSAQGRVSITTGVVAACP